MRLNSLVSWILQYFVSHLIQLVLHDLFYFDFLLMFYGLWRCPDLLPIRCVGIGGVGTRARIVNLKIGLFLIFIFGC
jgi:hypothetical protein